MAAYDFPLLSLFWSMLEFIALVIWFVVVVAVIFDIFRSRDLSGWAKALWFVLVLFLPILGLLAYLVVRGSKMTQHAFQSVDENFGAVSPGGTKTDELARLADLRDRGVITADEFAKQKAAILS